METSAPKLTVLAHDRWAKLLYPGAVAIDATVGNGHDTLSLLNLVGPTGWVHGFDTQAVALERTRALVANHANVSLHHASHAEMLSHVPPDHVGKVQLVVFNLGYLPHGDYRQTTQPASTRAALLASAELLAPGGWISVLAYRGHPGGESERHAVQELVSEWGWENEVQDSGSPTRPGPTWFLVRKCV
jgi:predicted methyltransferase